MKKAALFTAVVLMFSVVSMNALAEEPSTLELTASKEVAYTLSIPSGTKTVKMETGAQEIGEIGLTSANFTAGSIDVAVASANSFALVNGEVSVAYTLDKEAYSFTEAAEELDAVSLTVTDPAAAAIAGSYTDTLTFTATPNGVA